MITGLMHLSTYKEAVKFIANETGIVIFIMLALFVLMEWLGRENKFAIEKFLLKSNKTYRWFFYIIIILTIIFYGGSEQEFIYFQF